jgi:hypothetical protein
VTRIVWARPRIARQCVPGFGGPRLGSRSPTSSNGLWPVHRRRGKRPLRRSSTEPRHALASCRARPSSGGAPWDGVSPRCSSPHSSRCVTAKDGERLLFRPARRSRPAATGGRSSKSEQPRVWRGVGSEIRTPGGSALGARAASRRAFDGDARARRGRCREAREVATRATASSKFDVTATRVKDECCGGNQDSGLHDVLPPVDVRSAYSNETQIHIKRYPLHQPV